MPKGCLGISCGFVVPCVSSWMILIVPSKLNWSDEFNVDGPLDPLKQGYDLGDGRPTVHLTSIDHTQIEGKFTTTPGRLTNIFYGCKD